MCPRRLVELECAPELPEAALVEFLDRSGGKIGES